MPFDRYWHAESEIEARRGLARLGVTIPAGTWRDFVALARQLGIKQRSERLPLPELGPEFERRVRERAHALWEQDGRPKGGKEEYLERARELEAIAENPDAALLPNPMTRQPDPAGTPEQPVEPIEAVENQAEFPDPLADEGERVPAPMPEAWKNPT